MVEVKKRFMFINRRAPYGTIYGLEALDAVLAGSAFEQDISVVFLDDGVYQLMRNQDPSVLGMKHFTRTFRALQDFEITNLYVEEESLKQRGMTAEDLMDVPREDDSNCVMVISSRTLSDLMNRQDVILQF